jgi:hypothetical protein
MSCAGTPKSQGMLAAEKLSSPFANRDCALEPDHAPDKLRRGRACNPSWLTISTSLRMRKATYSRLARLSKLRWALADTRTPRLALRLERISPASYPSGIAPARSGLFEAERDFRVNAVLGDFTVLDCRFEFFYVNGADVAERVRRFADRLLRGIFPAFVGLRQHFDDFDKFGHDDASFSKSSQLDPSGVWSKTLPNLLAIGRAARSNNRTREKSGSLGEV